MKPIIWTVVAVVILGLYGDALVKFFSMLKAVGPGFGPS